MPRPRRLRDPGLGVRFLGVFRTRGGRGHRQSRKTDHACKDCFLSGHDYVSSWSYSRLQLIQFVAIDRIRVLKIVF
jgi:hypothetical protein